MSASNASAELSKGQVSGENKRMLQAYVQSSNSGTTAADFTTDYRKASGGDVAAMSRIDTLANKEWSTGANCTKEEYRYFSQYSTDQRWMESDGLIEESSVTAFMDDYYEKNPIDNSIEGTIARYSGMSLEQVDYTLGMAEYVNFVANYEPTERENPFYEVVEPTYYSYEGGVETDQEPVIVSERVVCFDLRGRTYTV